MDRCFYSFLVLIGWWMSARAQVGGRDEHQSTKPIFIFIVTFVPIYLTWLFIFLLNRGKERGWIKKSEWDINIMAREKFILYGTDSTYKTTLLGTNYQM